MQKLATYSTDFHTVWWKGDTWATEETVRYCGNPDHVTLGLGFGLDVVSGHRHTSHGTIRVTGRLVNSNSFVTWAALAEVCALLSAILVTHCWQCCETVIRAHVARGLLEWRKTRYLVCTYLHDCNVVLGLNSAVFLCVWRTAGVGAAAESDRGRTFAEGPDWSSSPGQSRLRSTQHRSYAPAAAYRFRRGFQPVNAVVTTAIRLRFDRRSTPIRLQFDRATTIRQPTLRPGCCTAA